MNTRDLASFRVARAGLVATATLAALVFTTSAAGETFYRWNDERGNPVHSDRPPPAGTEYEVINNGSRLVRKVEANEGAVPATTVPKVGNEFTPEAEQTAQLIQKNPEYCARAKENLETLRTNARVRIRNDEGEFYYLNDEEKEAQREKARDLIAVHCES